MRPYVNDKEFVAKVNHHSSPVGTKVVLVPKYFWFSCIEAR